MTVRTIPALFTAAAFLTALLLAALEDLAVMEIADAWHLMILALAGIGCVTMPEISPGARLAGLAVVSVPLFLIAVIRPGAFGGGDIKLAAVCGAFLGWRLMIPAAVTALFLGGVWSLLLLLKKRESSVCFPFGPCLCLGMLFSMF